MKKYLYIVEGDKDIQVTVISKNQITMPNFVGKRYDKVLIEKDIILSELQLLELRLCQFLDDDNWIKIVN